MAITLRDKMKGLSPERREKIEARGRELWKEIRMSWRYQPVSFVETAKGFEQTVYRLCEVYFDKDGKLENWSDPCAADISPGGADDMEQLTRDLAQMLADANCWEPVKF